MANAKTLKLHAKSLDPAIQPIKISKTGLRKMKTRPHDPLQNLTDPNFIAKALIECVLEGDEKTFKEILKSHYESVNITKALKKAKLSQRTFFMAVSPKGNPSLKTVFKLMKGIAA